MWAIVYTMHDICSTAHVLPLLFFFLQMILGEILHVEQFINVVYEVLIEGLSRRKPYVTFFHFVIFKIPSFAHVIGLLFHSKHSHNR